ncbi:acetoacetate--CoA ligase [Microlunatus parietis]|uniref:Acetoacetyl-CoA synthetase n=1 Tax=Microlunatus parietis TaxID=682979 RepID=A0A7Y9I7T8_9ACTN|nr:acetoacetate--CoA ligase [Microlunatus parietis]NYE71757.1 acetoacetyl-CoA synthetase [Microlunatus parietis]
MVADRTAGVELWTPDEDATQRSQVARFRDFVAADLGLHHPDYASLHRWSVAQPEEFWAAVWRFFRPGVDLGAERILADPTMPGARWCPGARLNFAEELLRPVPDESPVALIVIDERDEPVELTRAELRRRVAGLAETLRSAGIGPGDCVAAYLPNVAETVIALLAAASLGATWTSCSPDFGVAAVVSRFEQAEPSVILVADGYRYNGKLFDRTPQARELITALPGVRLVITVDLVGGADWSGLGPQRIAWTEAVAPEAELIFAALEFDHPLWVLWSSGTTGRPKGIVQSHGGIVFGFLASIGLGSDIRPDDRYCVITSASWMMWNYLVGGLMFGATVILYEGSPTAGGGDAVWRIAARTGTTVLGIGAGYLDAGFRAGARPRDDHDLSRLRSILQTGSPLPAEAWVWVSEAVSDRCWFASVSGGTDLCGVLVGASQLLPVYAGRMAAPYLGVDLHSWDPDGNDLIGTEGEMVITAPLPSMPIRLLGDPTGERYREAYFDLYPGVWRHGDWLTIFADGSAAISGRSDATLNRQGIRMGSADLYGVVDGVPGIADSLVIGVELPDGGYFLPLFVVTEPGTELDDALRDRIKTELRTRLSPRHVPDAIIAVPAVPRTLTGKKLEVPVKRILRGADLASVSGGKGSITAPEMLDWFADFARREPRLAPLRDQKGS